MSGLGAFLVSVTGPIVKKALSSLGIGLVTYAGVDAMVDQGLSVAASNWGSLGGTAAQLIAMSGANTALSVIAGGITASVTMLALKRFQPV